MAPGRCHVGTQHQVAVGAATTGPACGTGCLQGEAEEARSSGQGVQWHKLLFFAPSVGGQGTPGGSTRLGSAAARSQEPNAGGRDVAQHIAEAIPGRNSGAGCGVHGKHPVGPSPLLQTFPPAQPCEAICQASQYESINVRALSITLLHPQGQI